MRVEDDRLVRGHGRFADDLSQPKQLIGCFVRASVAHASIARLDAAPASAVPGVVSVLTGADIEAAGVTSISRHPPLAGRDGASLIVPPRPSLARTRVMHVGEPVALIVAETLSAARDAAELVEVEYEPLAHVTSVTDATVSGAPQLWPQAPGNVALDWSMPTIAAAGDGIAEIFEKATHIARVRTVNQRISVSSMEPRGATAVYDARASRYTLRACSQGATALRDQLVAVLGLTREQVDVHTDDVGGAFGMKTSVYPEYVALLVAARLTGRPVHWMSDRTEAFLTDNQARDTVTNAELALDAKGRFLALRVQHLAGMGAYIAAAGANIQTMNFARCFPCAYDIPKMSIDVRCVFTNTLPTGPYRGAGRPEANYTMERLVEEAARVSGIDAIVLRRRNLIAATAMPFKTAVGTVFDSGNFAPILQDALAAGGYNDFGKRRKAALREGKLRGIGVSFFLEHAGALPREGAALSFPGDGTILLGVGVHSTGQGHATVFPRLVAERLGIPSAKVRLDANRSRADIAGPASSSVGSRTTMTVGSALVGAVDSMLEKGRKIAASLLEATETDIEYRDGMFGIVGTDRRLSLFDVAGRATELAKAKTFDEDLDTANVIDTPQTFPNGCHVAEVEVDPETGETKIVSYVAVDDCGNVMDHVLVTGQMHGSIAQGLGQVLMENLVYDTGGQLITASFMDYGMPRATDMPPIVDVSRPTPATTNPLGVKGVGEAGTTGSLAAIVHAVQNAIGGDAHKLEMPLTTEKIWRACQARGA
ncbi:xanthine dehydrogenase family protein molybdopterin-binding subunit [Bradyrhizobium sp. LHD-71]|uniref:xanthine dehydrogenase family protein molybdopterin-binding subunit n=1 Tax=Bradyrhizobium sp. LHD-71 TaxID=3072141 RepID=UPI00280C79B5|nr:xanthine dehydrogenase family protein molybdopterin-binding subunit [Bradyrhizobium sp. LHD-71]MDQ8730625.1 xanthine dehydrogenase family protein molybdopterin-binding subunit [Bradyrhizobium sp. LHD-71]